MQVSCFTPFKASTDAYSLPERFTYPFYYQPHPLCLLAAEELQHYLTTQTQWKHNFGLDSENDLSTAIGKMFGVLLVRTVAGQLGYVSAFSGKLAEKNHLPHFVPPVFDMLSVDSFFLKEQREINQLTQQITTLSSAPDLVQDRKSHV